MKRRFPGQHKRVLIDTSIWIDHFEQHPELGAAASKIIESLEEGEYRGVASELTLPVSVCERRMQFR